MRRLAITIVTPAPRGSRGGNRVTALRWARVLRSLGARVRVRERDAGEPCDLCVALHATKSAESVERYRERVPGGPLVVALAGTDVYGGPHGGLDERALASLRAADLVVALQPLAADALPADLRARVRVVLQSASAPRRAAPAADAFEVCVLAHLRPVKDPLLAARAARLVPASSRLRVLLAGAALDPALADEARAQERANPRFVWLGPRPRRAALAVLARSRALVLSSRAEGGANVASEAIVAGVPILATRIAGNVGLLGDNHPGLFPAGDERSLADLFVRAEREPEFLAELASRSAALAPLFAPERERARWAQILAELGLAVR